MKKRAFNKLDKIKKNLKKVTEKIYQRIIM